MHRRKHLPQCTMTLKCYKEGMSSLNKIQVVTRHITNIVSLVSMNLRSVISTSSPATSRFHTRNIVFLRIDNYFLHRNTIKSIVTNAPAN